jgi:biopolymer transport protein ExbB
VDPREIDSVSASPDSLTDIGALKLASFENENYSAWPRSRRLTLNTTATGANVAGNAEDFPVLVRLDKGNFDFSQSRGNDIRFSDMKGKRLRYEIERWDSAAALAEIWVRLDRVLGNSSAQFLTLHWGIPGAEDFSDGRQVFTADAGFAGVWHLSQSAPDTTAYALYEDAVGYNPANDRTASADRSGVAGPGAGFGGTDHLTIPVAGPLLQPNAALTVSAWMRSGRTGLLGGNLLSMGDTYSLRVTPSGALRFSFFDGEHIALESPKGTELLDSAWHHVAASFDGAAMILYVDGKQVAQAAAKGFLDYRFSPAFTLGRHGNRKVGYEFFGNLDQVEVSGERARSAAWIRLAYESQREGSKLVEFGP